MDSFLFEIQILVNEVGGMFASLFSLIDFYILWFVEDILVLYFFNFYNGKTLFQSSHKEWKQKRKHQKQTYLQETNKNKTSKGKQSL